MCRRHWPPARKPLRRLSGILRGRMRSKGRILTTRKLKRRLYYRRMCRRYWPPSRKPLRRLSETLRGRVGPSSCSVRLWERCRGKRVSARGQRLPSEQCGDVVGKAVESGHSATPLALPGRATSRHRDWFDSIGPPFKHYQSGLFGFLEQFIAQRARRAKLDLFDNHIGSLVSFKPCNKVDASSRQGRVRSLSSASSSLRIARFGKSLLADVLDFGVNVRTPAQACAHSTGGVIMRVFYFAVGLVI